MGAELTISEDEFMTSWQTAKQRHDAGAVADPQIGGGGGRLGLARAFKTSNPSPVS